MNAIEFVKNGDSNRPDGELCSSIVQDAQKNGLILISCRVLTKIDQDLYSPLVISDELLNRD